jgi:hypothetical protein
MENLNVKKVTHIVHVHIEGALCRDMQAAVAAAALPLANSHFLL